jgi:hypothetical protein
MGTGDQKTLKRAALYKLGRQVRAIPRNDRWDSGTDRITNRLPGGRHRRARPDSVATEFDGEQSPT